MRCRICDAELLSADLRGLSNHGRCLSCVAAYARERRKRRKALGLRTPGGTWKDQEKHRRWEESYFARPEVKAAAVRRKNKYASKPDSAIKIEARHLVKNAVRNGSLVRQPCAICQVLPTEAHHADYGKPLDVVWLCEYHHTEVHQQLKRGESSGHSTALSEMP